MGNKVKIIIDTREQNPLVFRKTINFEESIKAKLDVGDYSIKGYENKISIERKSPADLFHTLGKDHKRFKRELERAMSYDYFAILVESPFSVVIDKEFENAHYCKMFGDTIIQICYTLKLKYGIDVIFCNGRSEATRIIKQIFKAYVKLRDKPNKMVNSTDDLELLSKINCIKRKIRRING